MLKKSVSFAMLAVTFVANICAFESVVSGEYFRSLARYATVNSVDAALYNPSGLTFLSNGLYLSINEPVLIIPSEKNVSKKSGKGHADSILSSLGATPLTPTGIIAFKKDNWAIYFTSVFPNLGGTVAQKFPLIVSENQTTNRWLAFTSGASIAVSPLLSLSLGVRVLSEAPVNRSYWDSITRSAPGVGAQFGITLSPFKSFRLSALYTMGINAFRYDAFDDSYERTYVDPSTVRVGLGWDIFEPLTLQLGFKTPIFSRKNVFPNEATHKTMDFSAGLEWQTLSWFKIGLSSLYQRTLTIKGQSAVSGVIPSEHVVFGGAGIVFSPPFIDISISYLMPVYATNTAQNNYSVPLFPPQQSMVSFGLTIRPDKPHSKRKMR